MVKIRIVAKTAMPQEYSRIRNRLPGILAFVAVPMLVAFASPVKSGTFVFAENLGQPDTITHPTGYTGSENELEVSVCVHPDSESRSELAIAIRNSLYRWNQLDPQTENTKLAPESGVPSNRIDAESVVLHEIGHCIGLAHPNLASESGLSGNKRRFAKALPGSGPDNGYTLDAGGDQIIATEEDYRGDDTNLNWFRTSNNNPFTIDSIVDGTTYSNNVADLPPGHDFPKVAGAQVSQKMGIGRTEAVMHQGILFGEKRSGLGHDDVATLKLAMSGIDRTHGTHTSYDLTLVYGGESSDCDITVKMGGPSLAYCSISGAPIAADHWAITNAHVQIGSASNINWHFTEQLLGDSLFSSRFSTTDQ